MLRESPFQIIGRASIKIIILPAFQHIHIKHIWCAGKLFPSILPPPSDIDKTPLFLYGTSNLQTMVARTVVPLFERLASPARRV